tara:strand:- start:339 stop:515 length:177 start_codon:yes stop_codon:yes gene_type:complete
MKSIPHSSDLNREGKTKMNNIYFWSREQVAFTALLQIQYLRASDKFKDAYSLMSEWNI